MASDEVTALLERILTNIVCLDKRYKEIRCEALAKASKDEDSVVRHLRLISRPLEVAAADFSDRL